MMDREAPPPNFVGHKNSTVARSTMSPYQGWSWDEMAVRAGSPQEDRPWITQIPPSSPVVLGFTAVNQRESGQVSTSVESPEPEAEEKRSQSLLQTPPATVKKAKRPARPRKKVIKKSDDELNNGSQAISDSMQVTKPGLPSYQSVKENTASLNRTSLAKPVSEQRELHFASSTLAKLSAFRYRPEGDQTKHWAADDHSTIPEEASGGSLSIPRLKGQDGAPAQALAVARNNLSLPDDVEATRKRKMPYQFVGLPTMESSARIGNDSVDMPNDSRQIRESIIAQEFDITDDDDLFSQFVHDGGDFEAALQFLPNPKRVRESAGILQETTVLTIDTSALNSDLKTAENEVSPWGHYEGKNVNVDGSYSSTDIPDDALMSASQNLREPRELPLLARPTVLNQGGTISYNVPTTLDSFPSRFDSAVQSDTSVFPQSDSISHNIRASSKDVDDEFGINDYIEDGIDIAQLMELTDQVSNPQPSRTIQSPPPTMKGLQWNPPKEYKRNGQSCWSSSFNTSSPTAANNRVMHSSSAISLPSTPLVSAPPIRTPPSSPNAYADSLNQPFVRSPFPTQILDRSPILGLSPSSPILTHFRLGAAINHAAAASRRLSGISNFVELYARVVNSVRDGPRQHFDFADIFRPDRAPFLHGIWVGWQGSAYWELDGKAFLGPSGVGRMCRVVGRIERGEGRTWRMCVLSIWEANWDDVAAVKLIVCV